MSWALYSSYFSWHLTPMIKFSGSVLFIDNTCLVYLFDELFNANRNHLYEVVSILNAEFDQIWIPSTIQQEFLLKRNDKKRKKLLGWAMKEFDALNTCPINVSKSEIISMIGNTEENAGEADAVLQMNKGRISDSHIIRRMTFFTQDRGAINMMSEHEHEVLDYNDFRSRLLESGIVLP